MVRYIKSLGALALCAAIALGAAGFSPAQAATQAELEAKIKLLEQSLNELKTQLGEVKVQQAQQAQAQAQAQESYLQAAGDKLPKWLERISFYGDLRMRYQHADYDDLNGKSKPDRDRFRFRLRFGARSQIHEDVEVGFRIVSGADDDPTSTNQTFGDFFSEKSSIGFDRAYVKYTPSFVPDKALDFTFGKAANPFLTTRGLWDSDVVPEGAFLKYTAMKGQDFQPFILGTVMFVDEHSDSSQNANAWGGQLGVEGKVKAFKFALATGYVDWGKFGDSDNVPPNIHGNPTYTENGQTRLSKFKVWDLYLDASYKITKATKVGVHGQYWVNTDATGPYDGKDTGWLAGADLSYSKFKFKAWYKNVEANASPGFISDSDSGYVNRKGYMLGVDYKVFKYGTLQVNYFDMKPVDDDINGASNGEKSLYVDFIFKF